MRWREPMPSAASRHPAPKSKAASRPIIVTTTDFREITPESGLEGKAVFVLMAHPDCALLYEQPEAVTYLDTEGVERSHTFDFLVVKRNGVRVAVAVKPSKKAIKYGLRGLLALIASQMDPEFATEVKLLTDIELRPTVVSNAVLIHDARRFPDPDVDGLLAGAVATINGAVTIGSLIRAAGLVGHEQAFYGAARAIGEGSLVACQSGFITLDSLVSAGARP